MTINGILLIYSFINLIAGLWIIREDLIAGLIILLAAQLWSMGSILYSKD